MHNEEMSSLKMPFLSFFFFECADIPDGGKAYKLFPDKIKADISKECYCGKPCGKVLLQDPYIVQRIQHTRSDYFDIPQGSGRTTKTVTLIRSSLLPNGSSGKVHTFEGKTICMQVPIYSSTKHKIYWSKYKNVLCIFFFFFLFEGEKTLSAVIKFKRVLQA